MRIKRGVTKRRRHNKVLTLAKGFRMGHRKLYRRAIDAVRHAGNYNFTHRKHRKSQKRTEWIKTISAALANSETKISYSSFIHKLTEGKIQIDRKNLAEMATDNPKHFSSLLKELK